MQFIRLLRLAALVAVLAAGLAALACGGDSSGGQVRASDDGSGAAAIEIAETDEGFEPNSVKVKAGQLVRVTFANKGNVIHNLRIAGPSGQFGGAGDFIIGDPVVQPGQKATGEWQAPVEPGRRTFRCDAHPNHTGVITIE
jgi:plastocyanin